MTDGELSTRDLADAADQSAERQADMPDDTGAGKTAPADEPLARERSELDDDSTRRDAAEDDARGPLLPAGESDGFTTRWREIQTAFVDEPRESVAKADALVAELMQRLATSFTEERQRLEGHGIAATTSRRSTCASH